MIYPVMSVSKTTKRKSEDEGRVLQERWDNIFFTAVCDKTVCLIFNNGASVLKEHNLRRHYGILNKHHFGILEVKQREDKLKNLKPYLQWQQNIFRSH
jgi:hypothetical protein